MADAVLDMVARLLAAPIGPTTSVVEVLWVALSVLGLALCLALHREASRNLWATERLSSSVTRRLVARRDLRTANRRVLMEVLFLALGIIAAGTPPPIHADNARAGMVSALLLIVAQVAILYDVGRDLLDQYRVRRDGADRPG